MNLESHIIKKHSISNVILNRKWHKILLMLFLVLLSNFIAYEQSFARGSNYSYKAIASFVYNFQKLIKNKSGNLCVYGYDGVVVEIESKYKDKTQFFKRTDNADDQRYKNCKLFYISKEDDSSMSDINIITDKLKIVSIGLSNDFIEKGGVILLQMGRRNFELIMNYNKIKDYQIQFDPIVSNLVVE